MNERLKQFLAAENISQAAFADKIDVARANVSHILSGRNRPGYDFFASLIRNYPSLNIEWLITGKGRMYKTSTQEAASASDLFSFPAAQEKKTETPVQDTVEAVPVQENAVEAPSGSPSAPAVKPRKAVKIIVFYDDNTFEEFEK